MLLLSRHCGPGFAPTLKTTSVRENGTTDIASLMLIGSAQDYPPWQPPLQAGGRWIDGPYAKRNAAAERAALPAITREAVRMLSGLAINREHTRGLVRVCLDENTGTRLVWLCYNHRTGSPLPHLSRSKAPLFCPPGLERGFSLET